MNTQITIYTSNLTEDSMDPDGIIAPGEWAAERRRYIEMAVAAVKEFYPDAEVETADGNGIKVFEVWVDEDNEDFSHWRDVEDMVQGILEDVWELWCSMV